MTRAAIVTAVATAILAIAALATLLFTVGRDDATDSTITGIEQSSQGESDACTGDQGATVTCIFGDNIADAEAKSDDELRETTFSDPPTVISETGPWPFIVYDDGGIGLKVRTTNTIDGVQIGGIPTKNTAWVICKETSDFNPDPERGVGALWYRVAWPTDTASTEYYISQPSDPHKGWAFAGYLDPVGHNGDVPTC